MSGSRQDIAPLPGVGAEPFVGVGTMVSSKAGRLPRLLVLLAAVLIAGVYVLPLWNVRLTAPQYPEGLGMHIRISTVEGATDNDLDNINNLNHYIGMKRIEAESIPELRYMPWIVAGLIVTGLGAAAIGRRKPIYAWTALFLTVAVVGLADFWKWEYDYGHNLDNEHAILKIPGMSYQPPLIGAKQLLNFRATSWPAAGGALAGLAMLLAIAAAFLVWRERRRTPARA
jgi:copper chaperone NosL